MISLGAITSVIKLVAHPERGVQCAALRFGIALLEEGNLFGQRWLLRDLMTDGTEFLRAMVEMINSTREAIGEHLTLLKKEEEKRMMSTRRSTGGIGTCRTARETAELAAEAQATLQLDAPRLAMRFLQLMCEGSNTDTQAYLKDQDGGLIGVAKTNMLQEVISLLEHLMEDAIPYYLEHRMDDIFPVLIQALHFLTETMIGPCRANQSDLAQSDLCSILGHIFATFSYDLQDTSLVSLSLPELC